MEGREPRVDWQGPNAKLRVSAIKAAVITFILAMAICGKAAAENPRDVSGHPRALLAGSRYVWSTYLPGQAIEYGVPETDDRSLRIDCAAAGLEISGPSPVDLGEGAKITLTFTIGGEKFSRNGTISEGDGSVFDAPVSTGDPIIAALLRGGEIEVGLGGYAWRVPGEGAERVLRPLIAACPRLRGAK